MNKNISGGISGALDPDSAEADEHAKQYYESVRKMTTDIDRISQNTDFSIEDIKKIKNHVFFDKHDLGDGRIDRFDSEFMMSQSWQRLFDGKNIQEHDLTLLKHELIEKYYEDNGMAHNQAHILAAKKYNYSKEAREYYVEINKHKKE